MLPTRGPVPSSDPRYVRRMLVDEVATAIARSEYVSLRGGRQTGKTTTLAAIAKELDEAGVRVAFVDLEGIRPIDPARVDDWLHVLLDEVCRSVGLDPDVLGLASVTSGGKIVDAFLRMVGCCGEAPVVVMLDEVTATPLELQSVFFSALRALFNIREMPRQSRAGLSARLSFVLAGTFDPDKLIDDQNSPFNVSHDFDTSEYDFTVEEIAHLCVAVGVDEASAGEVLAIGGGHPYLTNVVIQRVSDGESPAQAASSLLNSNDPNLMQLSSRLATLDPSVLEFLKGVARGEITLPIGRGAVPDLDRLFSAGVIRPDETGAVAIRAPIYAQRILAFQDTPSFLKQAGIAVAAKNVGATTPKSYDVGIIVALQEELAAVLEVLGDTTETRSGVRTYYTTSVEHSSGHTNVVVTLLMTMGNVESALAARDLMDSFSPKSILVVGVAGGADSGGQSLGDVLIADSIYYYESEKVTAEGCEIRPRMDTTSRSLFSAARALKTDDFGYSVHFGVIASGEQIVADIARVEEMRVQQPKLVGIEMESFGVYAATLVQASRVEFLAIRGVSDFADAHKDDSSRDVAAANASSFMMELLKAGPLP